MNRRDLLKGFSVFACFAISTPATSTLANAAFQSNTQITVPTIAKLKSMIVPALIGSIKVLGYNTPGDGGGGTFFLTNVNPGADNGGTIIWSNTSGYYFLRQYTGPIFAEWFGADNTGTNSSTTAIWNAIISMRANPRVISDGLSTNITAYSSGALWFGRGRFKTEVNQLLIYQDLGLTFNGQGSRSTNNAIVAPTTLVVEPTSAGASTDFVIQYYGNGARGGAINNMDVCYANSNFVGSVIINCGAPGFNPKNSMFGTVIVPARLQTALSCLEISFDEFVNPQFCVFDGAQYGIYSNDTRVISTNTFGGSTTNVDNCIFYDISIKDIWHQGNRARYNFKVSGTAFNPINIDLIASLDLRNILGVGIYNSVFVGSVGNHATSGWFNLENITGEVLNCVFDDFADIGIFNGGTLTFANNRCLASDKAGLNHVAGVLKAYGNRFTNYTSAYFLNGVFDVGPDIFDGGSTSYRILNGTGKVRYNKEQDNTIGGFVTVPNIPISIKNIDEGSAPDVTTNTVLSIRSTGRRFTWNGGSNGTITLPTPVNGTSFRIAKASATQLQVIGASIADGSTSLKTTCTLAGTAIGGEIEFEARNNSTWFVKALQGPWVIT